MQIVSENQRKEAAADVAASASLFSGNPIFSVRGLSKSFGPVEALTQMTLGMNAEVCPAKQIDKFYSASVWLSESRE